MLSRVSDLDFDKPIMATEEKASMIGDAISPFGSKLLIVAEELTAVQRQVGKAVVKCGRVKFRRIRGSKHVFKAHAEVKIAVARDRTLRSRLLRRR